MRLRSTVILPVIALTGIAFALYTVRIGASPVPAAQPVAPPSRPSGPAELSGSGIVESASEEIAIASPVGGVITEVLVAPGSQVRAGDPLLRLDDRTQRAQLAMAEAQVAAAAAQIARLAELPRAEDLAVAQAQVEAAATARAEAEAVWRLYEGATDAITAEQRLRARYAVERATAAEAEAKRAHERVRAGAWAADLAIAQAEERAAIAARDVARTEIERLTIRSPIAATVLQVKARPGAFAPAGQTTSLMLLGDLSTLHVRVDIDEHEAWRMQPGSTAEGCVRGNPALRTPLRFVRIEPLVIAKKSLTNDPSERVDTRVLQAVFACDPAALPVYVGQQLDVFIATMPH